LDAQSINTVEKFSFLNQEYMQNSFVYIRTENIHYIKILSNVYFLQIRLFFIKNFLIRILFALTVYRSYYTFVLHIKYYMYLAKN